MAAICKTISSNEFTNEDIWISSKMSSKYVFSLEYIDNKSPIIQKMACRRPGDKPLSELMIDQFTDAYMCHSMKHVWL